MAEGLDEVRAKPAGPQDNGYYDILVLGRTGAGKSSTVDKLMVPDSLKTGTEIEIAPHDIPIHQLTTGQDGPMLCEDEEGSAVVYQNLIIAGHADEEQEQVEKRAKNIIFAGSLVDSHEEINKLRDADDGYYTSTTSCQLLINEKSKIRALDVPGFYSPENFQGAENEEASNLAILRQVIRIQAIFGLRFQRILFFLQRGKIARADRILQKEIHQMVKFFGKSIFLRMVLVFTQDAHVDYDSLSPEVAEYKRVERAKETSQKSFQETVEREFKERGETIEGLAVPPLIFIAMANGCERILEKIRSAPIANDEGLQLEFSPNTCCRCAIEFGEIKGKKLMAEYRAVGDNRWVNAVGYEDSKCHPKMASTYTARSVKRGLKGLLHFKWKGFKEYVCINPNCEYPRCGKGCCQVGTEFKPEGKDPIRVDHTSTLD